MDNIIRNLLMAQRCAHVHHWKTKSFAQHLALGELYDKLTDFADELAEMFMGKYGQDALTVAQSDPNHFDERDPVLFIQQLSAILSEIESQVPSDGFILNKYQELQAAVAAVKYKLENFN